MTLRWNLRFKKLLVTVLLSLPLLKLLFGAITDFSEILGHFKLNSRYPANGKLKYEDLVTIGGSANSYLTASFTQVWAKACVAEDIENRHKGPPVRNGRQ